jgi:hypothetical protein
MGHEHGDVPGPTTKGGTRPANSPQPGQRAAEEQSSPPAPLGYGEEASENTGQTGNAPDPVPEKFYNPSEGESAARADAPKSGGGHFVLPGENS